MIGEQTKRSEGRKDLVDWIKRNFYIPETKHDPVLKGRIGLQKYQEDVLREILTTDENGNYKYSIVVWSDIKKSGKSTIAAAVNFAIATHSEFGELYVIANDLKQADSRVAHYLRRNIQLNDKHKKSCKMTGYKIVVPSGSYIEAIPIDPSGEAGSNADMITFSELWGANETAKQNMWCLDEETDVLTFDGWKKGIDLTHDDYIAAYRNGYVEWEKPENIFKSDFDGELHLYEHRIFSIACTSKHRLYGGYTFSGANDEKGKNFVMTSEELRNSKYSYYHPVTTPLYVSHSPENPPGVWLKRTKFHEPLYIPFKKWAAFLGLYLTEGSTSDYRGKPCHVKISQLREPHPEKYDEIHSILVDIFGDWVKVSKRDGFKISSTELAAITKKFGKTFEKRVPREIIHADREILDIFLHSYILGDGHIKKDGSFQITCASKGMADDLQEIAFRRGIRSSVRPHQKWWRVNLTTGNVQVSIHKSNWKLKKYKGKVWCPTVSSGLFVARREGRPFVTGNSEMTIPPTKYGKAFRWVESYAGFAGESNLLYSLYDLGVKQGEMLWPDRLYPVTDGEPAPLEVYVNKKAGMICLWNTKPRCPWQTKEYYQSEASILEDNQFQRMHRNQWVTSTETFLPMEWYDACKRSEYPEIPKDHPVVIAMDASVSGDSFGMWMGCRHPKEPEHVVKLQSMLWVPKGNKIDYQGTEENPGPELMLRRWIKDYNVICVAYDPFQLHDMAGRLRKEGLAWFFSFNQVSLRLLADSQMKDLIRDRRYWHRGEPFDREHFQNADAKIDTESTRIRIVKRAENLKVDLAVTASMGSYMVMRLNL